MPARALSRYAIVDRHHWAPTNYLVRRCNCDLLHGAQQAEAVMHCRGLLAPQLPLAASPPSLNAVTPSRATIEWGLNVRRQTKPARNPYRPNGGLG
jgi:hypothetical protein